MIYKHLLAAPKVLMNPNINQTNKNVTKPVGWAWVCPAAESRRRNGAAPSSLNQSINQSHYGSISYHDLIWKKFKTKKIIYWRPDISRLKFGGSGKLLLYSSSDLISSHSNLLRTWIMFWIGDLTWKLK